jgi:thioredoxin-like negative regulator of GroEL
LKKVIIFIVGIIIVFAGISFFTNMQSKKKAEGNPYGKDSLHPETIAQLDDPNYKNLILPEELTKKLADENEVTVYFYSPTCPHCKRTTPILAPLTDEMGIELHQYNLLEFEQGWDQYGIESTPTIVHYKAGKEVARMVGYHEKTEFEAWLTEYVLK